MGQNGDNIRKCASTLYLGLIPPSPLVYYKTKIQIYQFLGNVDQNNLEYVIKKLCVQ